MAQGSTDHHTQYGDGTVCAAFTGQYELTQRAAAQQHGAPAYQSHTQSIPQTVGVGDGLTGKAEVEVAGDQVADHNSDNNGDKAIQQLEILEHHSVTDAADGAQTGTLGQSTDDQADDQRNGDGSVLAAGALGGEVDEEHLKIAPTIVNDVDFDNPLMEEEIFGPILPLVEYNRIEEAIQYINSHDKPLALYLFSNDSYHANKILDLCSFGDACINDTVSHFATNTLPFGGVGASGIGYYHGKFTFETFSHRRSVLHKSTRIDLPFRYYPLTDDKMKWIKRFLK